MSAIAEAIARRMVYYVGSSAEHVLRKIYHCTFWPKNFSTTFFRILHENVAPFTCMQYAVSLGTATEMLSAWVPVSRLMANLDKHFLFILVSVILLYT